MSVLRKGEFVGSGGEKEKKCNDVTLHRDDECITSAKERKRMRKRGKKKGRISAVYAYMVYRRGRDETFKRGEKKHSPLDPFKSQQPLHLPGEQERQEGKKDGRGDGELYVNFFSLPSPLPKKFHSSQIFTTFREADFDGRWSLSIFLERLMM